MSDSGGASADKKPGEVAQTGGGGQVPAWSQPDLVLSSRLIGSYTPASTIVTAGATASQIAQQDVNHMAQASQSAVAAEGMVLYSYGKASNPDKPNQETGIAAHAASGSVHIESNTGRASFTADKSIEVSSNDMVLVASIPSSILLTAAGAAIEMDGTGITLKAPGKVEFKAAMKELGGPGSASASVDLKKASDFKLGAKSSQQQEHYLQFVAQSMRGTPLANKPYVLLLADGSTRSGTTDAQGRTEKVVTQGPQAVNIYIEDAEHEGCATSDE